MWSTAGIRSSFAPHRPQDKITKSASKALVCFTAGHADRICSRLSGLCQSTMFPKLCLVAWP